MKKRIWKWQECEVHTGPAPDHYIFHTPRALAIGPPMTILVAASEEEVPHHELLRLAWALNKAEVARSRAASTLD